MAEAENIQRNVILDKKEKILDKSKLMSVCIPAVLSIPRVLKPFCFNCLERASPRPELDPVIK